ncbi:hypothetical protein [Mycobacterium sp. 23]|uniref:hypothetical protein n=1 Tax=Mycobacterium sp. 23 TaxID=3400424 RepID=UPI003AAA423C
MAETSFERYPECAAPRRRRAGRAGILAAVLVVVVFASIVAVIVLSRRSAEESTAAPAGPLDGTFIAEFGPRTDIFGNAYQGNVVTENFDGPWSIRSMCRANGCLATASYGRQNSKLSRLVFDEIDGRWLAVAVAPGTCDTVGTDVWVIFTVQPRPDGTLSGEYLEAPQIQCGAPGIRGSSLPAKQILTFRRSGNVDSNVQVADSEAQPPRLRSPAQGLHGQYLETMQQITGTYTLSHSVKTYCVRTGDHCIGLIYTALDFTPLVFAGKKWTVNLERDMRCASGGAGRYTDFREFPLPPLPQDPIPILTGRAHQQVTGGTPCDSVYDFDDKFERTGE